MMDMLTGASGSWVTELLTLFVYVAIAVLFVLCVIKCVLPVLRTRRVLRRAIAEIKKRENAQKSWQDETFLGKGALYPHWSDYLNNLFFADGEFHNPSSVEDYINEDTAVYGPGRAQFAEAAPGLMVSLGFLGTLIGMSLGLRGFDMSDAERVMAAIRQLVPGMQYAFTTSIVGVICSIGITLLTKVVDGAACRTLQAFYSAMNRYAGVLSVDPMTQIAIYQQEQTALIQGMAKDLSGAMTERMAQAMSEAVTTSLDALKGSLDDFTTRVAREQMRGVDMMVQRFLQQLDERMGSAFAELGEAVQATARNQAQMNAEVKRSVEGLTRVSQNVLATAKASETMFAKYDEYLTRLTATAKLCEDGYARIASNVEHLEVVAHQQNAYLQSVGHMQESIEGTLTDLNAARDRFTKALQTQVQGAAATLTGISETMQRSGDLLATNHRALVGGISKDIDHSYNMFFKTTNETIEHMGWTANALQETMAKLPDVIEGAAETLARGAERIDDTLRAATQALDEAALRLSRSLYENR